MLQIYSLKLKTLSSTSFLYLTTAYKLDDLLPIFKILTGEPTRKRPLGRSRRRWEYNIRMDLEIGVSMGNWVDSAQDMDYCKGQLMIHPPSRIVSHPKNKKLP